MPETNKKGKVGLYFKGELVLDHEYKQIWCVDHKVVTLKEDKFQIYNGAFELMHEDVYDDLISFKGDWTVFERDNKIVAVDGEYNVKTDFSALMNGHKAGVLLKKDNKFGMISSNGDLITDFIYERYDQITSLEDFGVFVLHKKGYKFFVNDKGEELLVLEDFWRMRTNNAFAYKKGEKWGVYCPDGTCNFPLSYLKNNYDIKTSESPVLAHLLNYYAVKKRAKGEDYWHYGLMSKDGELVVDFGPGYLSYSCISSNCKPEQYVFVKSEDNQCIMSDYQLKEMGRVVADEFIGQKGDNWIFLKNNRLIEYTKDSFKLAEQTMYQLGKFQIIENQEGFVGMF